MSSQIYTERILDYWEKAQNAKHPSTITHRIEVQSPICADNVYCEAHIVDDVLQEIGMFPRGCCLCDAASVIVAEYFEGRTLAELATFTEADLHKLIGNVPEDRNYCVSMGLRALQGLK